MIRKKDSQSAISEKKVLKTATSLKVKNFINLRKILSQPAIMNISVFDLFV
jgi:hypothetical protein